MNFSMIAVLLSASATAIAFFGVYFKLQSFLFMPINGLGQASIPIIGYNFGAGKYDRIRETYRTAIIGALSFAAAATLVFQLFPAQLLSLFSAGEEMLAIGIPAIRIISLTFMLASFTMVTGYAGSALGNAMINMIANLLRQIVILVPLSAFLLTQFGLGKNWYAFWAGELCAFLFSFFAIRTVFRKIK